MTYPHAPKKGAGNCHSLLVVAFFQKASLRVLSPSGAGKPPLQQGTFTGDFVGRAVSV